VETVPDDEAEPSGWGLNVFDPDELLTALKVEIGDDTHRVFFLPFSDFRFQAVQVLDCPIQSELMIGLVDHGKRSMPKDEAVPYEVPVHTPGNTTKTRGG
jgi:hypothetical protein